jgi:hypothetical protein
MIWRTRSNHLQTGRAIRFIEVALRPRLRSRQSQKMEPIGCPNPGRLCRAPLLWLKHRPLTQPNRSTRRPLSRLSRCRPPTPKAEGVSLTRWEVCCAVYLGTLESRDAICASWRSTSRCRCAVPSEERSVQEPDPASRRLHAGCRSGSLQANPRAYPGSSTHLRFRHHLRRFDTSSPVRFRSPFRNIPDGISSRLLLQRSPNRF